MPRREMRVLHNFDPRVSFCILHRRVSKPRPVTRAIASLLGGSSKQRHTVQRAKTASQTWRHACVFQLVTPRREAGRPRHCDACGILMSVRLLHCTGPTYFAPGTRLDRCAEHTQHPCHTPATLRAERERATFFLAAWFLSTGACGHGFVRRGFCRVDRQACNTLARCGTRSELNHWRKAAGCSHGRCMTSMRRSSVGRL